MTNNAHPGWIALLDLGLFALAEALDPGGLWQMAASIVDWASVLVSVGTGLVVGIVLWIVLPRGVVITRRPKPADHTGAPQFDQWEIRNESALPVRIVRVTHNGVDTYNPDTHEIETRDLPPEGLEHAAWLRFDDGVAEITREEREQQWGELELPPGDTLTAYVVNNKSLTIHYRRAGFGGVFERRELHIDGGV